LSSCSVVSSRRFRWRTDSQRSRPSASNYSTVAMKRYRTLFCAAACHRTPVRAIRRPDPALRAQRDLLNRIRLMLPVQSPLAKIFRFTFHPNHFYLSRHPGPHRGAFRDRHERKVGMRWTQAALLTRAHPCGRRSRVVLTPRRWRQVGERNFAGDGDNKARSPGRARRKPLTPSRAGMPGVPVRPW
jgi:hypothetical protein